MVTIPEGHFAERQYAIHVLLYVYLGLPYALRTDAEARDYTLQYEQSKIRIADAFFGRFGEMTYLNKAAIPVETKSCTSPGLRDIVCIFGDDTLEISRSKIACGVDIIAGTFFMLTRWEETVRPERDSHGRFPAEASLAWKCGFLGRPVVNEYVALLRQWLTRCGVTETEMKRHIFSVLLTCDVDFARYWSTPWRAMLKSIGAAMRNRSLASGIATLRSYRRYLKRGSDPYDTYDHLMQLAEKTGGRGMFCFLAGGNHPMDSAQTLHRRHVQEVFHRIRQAGHDTGIHFSYRTADDASRAIRESEHYERMTGQSPTWSRQHFLRCSIPETWVAWERSGMRNDLSMGYPEAPGFRCGTCLPFPLFDVRDRRMLNVVEHPLLVMDVTLRHYLAVSPGEAIARSRAILRQVHKHNGEFVILWHNSSFGPGWEGWESVLEEIVSIPGSGT